MHLRSRETEHQPASRESKLELRARDGELTFREIGCEQDFVGAMSVNQMRVCDLNESAMSAERCLKCYVPGS